ncbi:uridine 5'-monophosphate synthase-like [Convolutriloba macropyga]|uniref:uridine 5'-monophosphate synthase-like n=1 Tax=Convolutriloba macropyga TaxID=536237 RepID=UPI003F528FA1
MGDNFIEKLIEIGCLKFGDFTLKSGQKSPLYCDLRVLISYPGLMTSIADALWSKYCSDIIGVTDGVAILPEKVCGVPYTALPIATHYSIKHCLPMILRRKEAKSYGTKKLLEGKFEAGESCLIVEDVVTTGSSVLETAHVLRCEGLKVTDAIVFVDREQGALEALNKEGIRVTPLITMQDIVRYVTNANNLPEEQINILKDFVSQSKSEQNGHCKQVTLPSLKPRIDSLVCKNGQRLLKTILKKQSNLCLSADLTECKPVLDLIESVGSQLCCVKLHVDILQDIFQFGVDEFIAQLVQLSERLDFMIIEDRKFSDIGNTFKMQLFKGPFKIANWAHFVTAHSISGSGMLGAVKSAQAEIQGTVPGVIFVSEMSSSNCLITSDYTKKTVELAKENTSLVTGFVYRKKELFEGTDTFLRFMPGVSLDQSTDGGDQNYVTVEQSIAQEGADVIIVGRAILKSCDALSACKEFKQRAWKAFSSKYSDV